MDARRACGKKEKTLDYKAVNQEIVYKITGWVQNGAFDIYQIILLRDEEII